MNSAFEYGTFNLNAEGFDVSLFGGFCVYLVEELFYACMDILK